MKDMSSLIEKEFPHIKFKYVDCTFDIHFVTHEDATSNTQVPIFKIYNTIEFPEDTTLREIYYIKLPELVSSYLINQISNIISANPDNNIETIEIGYRSRDGQFDTSYIYDPDIKGYKGVYSIVGYFE